MGSTRRIWCVSIVLLVLVTEAACRHHQHQEKEEEEEEVGHGHDHRKRPGGSAEKLFILRKLITVLKTNAGDMQIVKDSKAKFMRSPMHVGFINMNPTTLFIPHYLDSTLILFIRSGEATVGHLYKGEMVETKMKKGDVYRIQADSPFYVVNPSLGERLHAIYTIFDASLALGSQSYLSDVGMYPTSALAGFDRSTLSAAFNITEGKVEQLIMRQLEVDPIVFLSGANKSLSHKLWSEFLDMKSHQKVAALEMKRRNIVSSMKEEEKAMWNLRKFLTFSLFGEDEKSGSAYYNIYHKKPDFENTYGRATALDESNYPPLTHEDLSLYFLNLSAGSMVAPHMNPRAVELGIVLSGNGSIQIAYPNGSAAVKAELREGDVFSIPRYFSFCQIASRDGPLEVLGFTTSARTNRPQFLAGANSVLQALRGPEIGAAFGMTEADLMRLIDAQRNSIFLSATPPPSPSPPLVL